MLDLVRTLLGSVLDLIYPPQCLVCERAIASEACLVCEDCRVEMPRLPLPVCGSCGAPSSIEGTRMCPHCPEEQHFDRARSGFDYHHEPMRKLIHAFKFSGHIPLAEPLGEWLLESKNRLYPDAEWDIVVGVPLHNARLRQREYNQVERMSAALIDACTLIDATGALQRVRNTRPQSKLTPQQRKQNLAGAFVVNNPTLIAGQRILIVDDIFTTGCTANELARVLREAGATRIDVLTLTRAFDHKQT